MITCEVKEHMITSESVSLYKCALLWQTWTHFFFLENQLNKCLNTTTVHTTINSLFIFIFVFFYLYFYILSYLYFLYNIKRYNFVFSRHTVFINVYQQAKLLHLGSGPFSTAGEHQTSHRTPLLENKTIKVNYIRYYFTILNSSIHY